MLLLPSRRLCQGLGGDLSCEHEGKAKEMFSASPVTPLSARERGCSPNRLTLQWPLLAGSLAAAQTSATASGFLLWEAAASDPWASVTNWKVKQV